jgi:hypothetical protein
MYEVAPTRPSRPNLTLASSNRQDTRARILTEGALLGLREVPGLPLRVGRHLTAWVVWHTARVSMLSDLPAEGRFDGSAKHSL